MFGLNCSAHFCGRATFEKEISFHLIAACDLIRTHSHHANAKGRQLSDGGRGTSPHATATHTHTNTCALKPLCSPHEYYNDKYDRVIVEYLLHGFYTLTRILWYSFSIIYLKFGVHFCHLKLITLNFIITITIRLQNS